MKEVKKTKKKTIDNKNKPTIKLYEALFFGICTLLLVAILLRVWWW